MSGPPSEWWRFCIWGIGGGAAVLAMDVWTTLRERKGKIPDWYKRTGYWIGESLRVAVGGILAIALGEAQQVTVPLGALTVGIAAPLILKRLGDNVSLPSGPAPVGPEVKHDQQIRPR